MKNKKIVGRKEIITILDLNLIDLDAKVDTGADSNALHCDHIEIENGNVSFTLLDEVHPSYHGKRITLPIYKIKRVKSVLFIMPKPAFEIRRSVFLCKIAGKRTERAIVTILFL